MQTFEERITAAMLDAGCTQDTIDDLLELFCFLSKQHNNTSLAAAAAIKVLCA